jgi:type II secretory pathway pseudopilin PulG
VRTGYLPFWQKSSQKSEKCVENVQAVTPKSCRRASSAGFSLIEAMMAVAAFALLTLGVFGGLSACFQTTQITRENLRATQVLQQATEVLRLCNWNQSNPSSNFIPTSLTVPYDSANSNGLNYQVSVVITNPPGMTDVYTNDLRMVTIQVTWTSGNIQRTRSMTTFASQYGLQNYVW